MKYAVEQKYFNSGRVSVQILEVEDSATSTYEEKEKFDLYVDVCASLEEAQELANEARNA